MKTNWLIFLMLPLAILLSRCDDDDDAIAPEVIKDTVLVNDTINLDTVERGSLKISIDHVVGNEPFALSPSTFTNDSGVEYRITTFKYYLSNVVLRRRFDFSFFFFEEPESYHLYQATDANLSQSVVVEGVPVGQYDELDFAIGVDNIANYSIDQEGDLSPNNDMAWNWNSGYIFMKMEGWYDSSGTERPFVYHIGRDPNFARYMMDYRSERITISKDSITELRYQLDIAKILDNINYVPFQQYPTIMGGPNDELIGTNLRNGLVSKLN